MRDDFTDEEWTELVEGPFLAGVLIVLASPNIMGIPKESFAMVKAARNVETAGPAHDLVTILVADMDDKDDSSRFNPEGSADEVKDELVSKLATVAAVVDAKCDPDVASGYKQWVAAVALTTAEASKEGSFLGIGGKRVTEQEHAALEVIDVVLGR